jgi:hypothetical protein
MWDPTLDPDEERSASAAALTPLAMVWLIGLGTFHHSLGAPSAITQLAWPSLGAPDR